MTSPPPWPQARRRVRRQLRLTSTINRSRSLTISALALLLGLVGSAQGEAEAKPPERSTLASWLDEAKRSQPQELERWEVTRWDLEAGLPQSSVTGITMASDGRLWVSTFAGLSRFNGQQFELFKDETREVPVRITAMLRDPLTPEVIWLSTEGEGLWRLIDEPSSPEHLSVTKVSMPITSLNLTIYRMSVHTADDPRQGLWLATDQGLYQRTSAGTWLKHLYIDPKSSIFDVSLSPSGALWRCARTIAHTTLAGESKELIVQKQGQGEPPACRGGVLSERGEYLVLYEDALRLLTSEGSITELKVLNPYQQVKSPHKRVKAPKARSLRGRWQERPWLSPRGELWVLSEATLWQLGEMSEVSAKADRGEPIKGRPFELSHPGRVMYESDPTTLWVGTTGGGLYRFSKRGFNDVKWPKGSLGIEIGPLTSAGDEVWFVKGCQELWRHQPQRSRARARERLFSVVPLEKAPYEDCISSLGARASGDVLIAREQQLLSYDRAQDRFEELWGPEHLSALGQISVIKEKRGHKPLSSGDLWWVGTRRGELLELAEGHPPQRVALPSQIANAKISSILELSTSTGGQPDLALGHALGVSVRRGEVWQTWTHKEGLPRGEVRDLYESEGVLWALTYGGGLGWLQGEVAGAIPVSRQGLNERFLSSLHVTQDGSLWLQGNKGLMRARLSDLSQLRASPERPVMVDWLKVGEANGWLRSSAALTIRGDLWLSGVDRVAVVETSSLVSAQPLPPPQLTTIKVGDMPLTISPLKGELTPQALREAPSVRAPLHELRRLEVSYMSTLLKGSEGVSYEHRLTPLDRQGVRLAPITLKELQSSPWVVAGSSQLATYPQLNPGRYLFEVRSLSLEHPPSEVTRFVLSVPHQWHELTWVRLLGVLLSVALSALIAMWRARFINRHNQELRAEITRRREIEQRLSAREAHYRQVFNQAANAFLLYDESGRCVEVNPQASALFGATAEVLTTCEPKLLGLPSLEHLLESDEATQMPLLCHRIDGGVFPARMSYVRCKVDSHQMWLVSVMDLSAIVTSHERQTWVQHQLAVAKRMDALGRLASGIAHDLNNILGALTGNIELLGEDLPSDDPFVQESLEDVRESVTRGSLLSQQLLAFSRRKTKQRVTQLDPVEVLRSLEKLLHRLMPQGVTLITEHEPVGSIKLDRGLFEQVLLTLTLHAAEASPLDGEVKLKLELSAQQALRLVVEDQGPAIPLGALRAVLEGYEEAEPDEVIPALSVVKRALSEGNGELSVRRYHDRNLIVVEWSSVGLTPLPEQAGKAKSSAEPERALDLVVVDDNHELRRALVRQLKSLGHKVTDFGDPLEALERVCARETAPHVLITDVIMPGMNGRQLANEVRARFENLPVIFISGYTSDVLGEVNMSGDHEVLLHKPFTKEVLRRKINQLMSSHTPVEPS